MSEREPLSVYVEGPKRPGVCIPFEEKVREWPPIQGETEIIRRTWEEVDNLAYLYVWHVLVSF